MSQGEYLPLKPNQLGQNFPVRCISTSIVEDVGSTQGLKNLPPGVSIGKDKDYSFAIHVTDRLKRRWALKMGIGLGGQVWASDLDGNGQEDLIVMTYTGGCGITPTTQLTFLMFDRQRTPRLYRVNGYFDGNEKTVDDLRKVNGYKKALLVVQVLAYESKSKKSYWRTDLWEANQSGWTILRQFRGVHLPAYTLYTFKPPNHKISSVRREPTVGESEFRNSQILPVKKGQKDEFEYFGPE